MVFRSRGLGPLSAMCIRVVEKYAACHCTYHIHGVDACSYYGRHPVTDRIVYVGYACPRHSRRRSDGHDNSTPTFESIEEARPSSYRHDICIYGGDQKSRPNLDRLATSAPPELARGRNTNSGSSDDSPEQSESPDERFHGVLNETSTIHLPSQGTELR